ncbi:hypothetical protein, partial [Streptosporangium lutulentum]|uniref:hypothetical protein n=1 Tax=Streptosporangium lutulentum TaxID=1461250 RepID=UPI00362AA9D7
GVAAETLAARWSVSAASVLTTASAVLLAVLTGHREPAMQLIVANRHASRSEAMVGTAAQDGLFVLDLPGGTFADAVHAGHRQALSTYRYAQYDPFRMMALREEAGLRRGGAIDLSAYFNDARTLGHWPDLPGVEPAGDPAAIAALTERTRTFFVGAWPKVDATAFFATGPATNACLLYLLVDTARLSRSTAYTLLRGVETLLVGCVAGEVPLDGIAELCGITPIERPGDWVMTGPDWSAPQETGPARTGQVDTGGSHGHALAEGGGR